MVTNLAGQVDQAYEIQLFNHDEIAGLAACRKKLGIKAVASEHVCFCFDRMFSSVKAKSNCMPRS